jgi:hypothetical protein
MKILPGVAFMLLLPGSVPVRGQVPPLVVAAMNGDAGKVKEMLSSGSSPNESYNGITALHFAAGEGNDAIVALLLAAKADVNAKAKSNGATPLHGAAEGGRESVVRALLRAGADPDAAMRDGSTPLIVATLNKQEAVARALVENGADVNARLDFTVTALGVAEETHQLELARFLRSRGARKLEDGAVERKQSDERVKILSVRKTAFFSYFDLRSRYGFKPGPNGPYEIRAIADTVTALADPAELNCGPLPVKLAAGATIVSPPTGRLWRLLSGRFRIANLEISGCAAQSRYGILLKDSAELRYEE